MMMINKLYDKDKVSKMATVEKVQEQHGMEEHEVTLWPPFLALSSGLVGLAILFFANDMIIPSLAALLTFFVFLLVFIYHETSPRAIHRPEIPVPRNMPRYMWMWIFLASETLFFGLLIGISLDLRIRASGWAEVAAALARLCGFQFQRLPESVVWPNPSELLNIPLTSIATFVLILSSVFMVKAIESIERGNKSGLVRNLAFVVLSGGFFLGFQLFEYYQFFLEGHNPLHPDFASLPSGDQLFWATFYLQTGFHGAHVFFGLILVAFVLQKAIRGGYTKENFQGVELVGIYWHFVDFVWVFIFTIVYLF